MDEKRTVNVSKLLALVLRHNPGAIGMTLGEGGWVAVDALIAACGRAGRRFSRAELDHVVATNNKKRFEYSADGRRIRASQGHSVEVDLGLAAAQPPAVLYHGTATTTLPRILREGLRPMTRQDVHLSADVETAVRVGSRHGRPAVIEVDAAALAADGHVFRVSANGVWLTDRVPPARLRQRPV
ncbi:RNA 2'-phosphotransferase [Streptomyces sp. H10-C2]|uniref:RNA 2'-phosphotransferase n=1 Tax=unclassified Streptomyces TaxID=2593676 RepID=UPI0024B9CA67|nr:MULTISPECIES: RNA 2'-phosphotransferase [unclassified Streptomyces]MDJ0344858.1 RNA 2'-phosphotransferase [Streptomyces sp. PH10-H1]MDJ0371918.1 RNA 2'-phosphotransferase [Streptomyces sp. H10-C2]